MKTQVKLVVVAIMVITIGLVAQPYYNPQPLPESATSQNVIVTLTPNYQPTDNDVDNKEVAKLALATLLVITVLFIMLVYYIKQRQIPRIAYNSVIGGKE